MERKRAQLDRKTEEADRAAASSGKREHEWRWMGITMGDRACAQCKAKANSLAATTPCPGPGGAERAEPERCPEATHSGEHWPNGKGFCSLCGADMRGGKGSSDG